MEKILSVRFPLEPVAMARPRVTKFGTYTPKKQADFKKQVRQMGKYFLQTPIEGYLKVEILLLMKKPARPKHPFPCRVDADNCFKLCLDSLNEIFWTDDRFIVDLSGSKRYADKGSFTVTIWKIEDL